MCDRDNLSPLKEFRDISSSRVRSVAKTRRHSDRRRGRCPLAPPSHHPPTQPLHPLGRHLAKIRPTRKKSVRSTAIITWCACYADYATVCCCCCSIFTGLSREQSRDRGAGHAALVWCSVCRKPCFPWRRLSECSLDWDTQHVPV